MRDCSKLVESLENAVDIEVNFYVELSKPLGKNHFDYRILRFAADPEYCACGIVVAEVVCHGYTFKTRKAAIENAVEWIDNQLNLKATELPERSE